MVGRIVRWLLAAILVVVAVVVGLAVWRFSDEVRADLLTPPVLQPSYPTLRVIAVGEGALTLDLSDGALTAGTWGLAWEGGYGELGAVVHSDDTAVVREFQSLRGLVAPGQEAILDPVLYDGDPLTALGIQYEELTVAGADGPLPAWAIAGENDTTVVLVHGSAAAGRAEVLRMIPIFTDLGYPVLVASLRGDPGAPTPESGLFSWGFEEWRDVEAAMLAALVESDDVVLFGIDAGAAAVAMTLRETGERRSIVGAILDSAVLDLAAVEDLRVERDGLGGAIAEWGRALASFRFGVEWTRLDQVSNADQINRPVLVLHGTADEFVPVAVAEQFSAALGDLATYRPFVGGVHNALWNLDQAGYRGAIRSWLAAVDPADEDSATS